MRHRPLDFVSTDGTMLAATLSLPRWARRPVPAVVIVHGSGPLTRAHLFGDVRRLVWEGFGVLAYDKRGAGASQGVYPRGWGADAESVLRLLAQDAASALDRARRDPDVDASRVGFFGASQAGWIIPLASAQLRHPPRFHVLLSSPAVSTGVEELYSALTGDGLRPPELTDAVEIEKRVTGFSGLPGFDPVPVLAGMKVPTLWLLGARDESVPTFATVRAIEGLRKAGNDSHTVIVYPDANHGLRNVTSGRPAPLWTDTLAWLRRIGVIETAR
jgi:dienelactone hydrolase